jgi:hypothetical protein
MYKVRYTNPEKPGSGFIDGFKLARDAKQAVANYNALYAKLGHGIRAEYLGKNAVLARGEARD